MTINLCETRFCRRSENINRRATVSTSSMILWAKDTYEKSLDCLAPLGVLVIFGQASGPVPSLRYRGAERQRDACVAGAPGSHP